jgi:putative membrane protein
MFWDHGLGMGWMTVSWLVWLVIIVAVVWVATRAMNGGGRVDESPESILTRRYARGDIDRQEYERRLDDIRK